MKAEHLETAVKALKADHDDLTKNVQRWGYVTNEGQVSLRNSGCYGGMLPVSGQDHTTNGRKTVLLARPTPAAFLVFHGDGPEFTFEELTDFDKRNEKIAATPRGHNQFEGTWRSLRWVKFLLSKKSPWRDLIPFLAIKDAKEINQTGWIFENGEKLPQKLFYNFAMAQRMLWEQPECAAQWFLLMRAKVDPTVALFIASNFFLAPEAKNIQGPWTVYYPWSYLEGGGLDCAYHFIKGKPRTIKTHIEGDDMEVNTPNVLPLWQCDNHAPWVAKTNELVTRTDLMLDEIRQIVDEAVVQQEPK